MINSLFAFEKEIQKNFPSLSLIIAKEKKESINLILNHWKGVVKTFEGETFSASLFLKEVESFFLFEEPFLLHIHQSDLLKDHDKQVMIKYLKNSNPKVYLLLTSATSQFSKEVKEVGGIVVQLSEEKPWQKKKRMEEWVKEKSKQEGFFVKTDALQYFVSSVGSEKENLEQELEKLMTYAFEKKEITLENVKALIDEKGFYTLWDLGEAFFMHDYLSCYRRLESLLESGISFFALLSQLRTQVKTLLEMASLYELGGNASLIEGYPYLKGAILTKKIDEIKKNPPFLLNQYLFYLFEAELKLRTINSDPLFIFELFLLRANAAISSSQSLR